ncbi:DUF2190 family protein [Citricoccus sp. K5]|uniref:DUF2190 family protein n=1 Tax=Citricoccus sp. K5 TaxID=2653135 RepID=UPI0012F2A7DF|nr:DUF2190 family protein [Citricoccus sp. K5]VXA92510.1 conserved hypothetical protein [Citricoccus sp. K5]VXA94855.1 conserved hypothetical protein [Citricoccus sp. K5]
MAKNMRLPEALHISLPVPAYVVPGSPVAVGAFRGIAQTERFPDGTATVWLNGSADVTVTGAVANVGDPVYITAATGALTTTATDNLLFGFALATKAAAAGPVEVSLLNGPAQA